MDKFSTKLSPEIKSYLLHPEDFVFYIDRNLIYSFPKLHYENYMQISRSLHVIHAGIPIGELKGKDLIPSHSLAMSTCLNPSAFPGYEADLPTAISYLKRETIQVPSSIPRGYMLLTYKNLPLGLLKNIGNRSNNLYPSAWRIRSSYI